MSQRNTHGERTGTLKEEGEKNTVKGADGDDTGQKMNLPVSSQMESGRVISMWWRGRAWRGTEITPAPISLKPFGTRVPNASGLSTLLCTPYGLFTKCLGRLSATGPKILVSVRSPQHRPKVNWKPNVLY